MNYEAAWHEKCQQLAAANARHAALAEAARGVKCACHTELPSGQHWAKCKMPELLAALAAYDGKPA